jgi:hypothetical protein
MIYAPFALFLLFFLEADLTGRVFFVVAWYRGTLCRLSSFLNSHLAFHSYGCFGVRQRWPVNMHILMGCNVSQPVRPRTLFKSNQREITVERETMELIPQAVKRHLALAMHSSANSLAGPMYLCAWSTVARSKDVRLDILAIYFDFCDGGSTSIPLKDFWQEKWPIPEIFIQHFLARMTETVAGLQLGWTKRTSLSLDQRLQK